MAKNLVRLLLLASVIELLTSYNFPKTEEMIYVPFPEVLRKIEQEEYIKGENDCRQKAIKYHRYLTEHGENSYIVECWNIKNKPKDKTHGIVIVKNKETRKYHFIDPTCKTNLDGKVISKYSEKWIILRQYRKNVTINDLGQQRRKVLKRFDKNIELKKRLVEDNKT